MKRAIAAMRRIFAKQAIAILCGILASALIVACTFAATISWAKLQRSFQPDARGGLGDPCGNPAVPLRARVDSQRGIGCRHALIHAGNFGPSLFLS